MSSSPSSTPPATAGRALPAAQRAPSAYPAEWNVQFDPAVPLTVSPPPPFDATDDGFYRQPYWAERYTGFSQEPKVYPVGLVTHLGAPPLKVALRKDQDLEVTLRDGIKIFVDVIRPADSPSDAKLPTLVAWSPYGKTTPKSQLTVKRYFTNLPADRVSGFAVAEGPDPAFWAQHGYAVVHVDHRGVNKSGGNVHWWGSVNAEDGYDVIEWIAEQSWSNGKVGMSGVSWLGISQLFVAATRPPHLAAVSPRAHWYDIYRQQLIIGGIPACKFLNDIGLAIMGEGSLVESLGKMCTRTPLWTPYWEDKVAKLRNISIPIYMIAGGQTNASEGFSQIPEGNKWLRYAPDYHLADYYSDKSLANDVRFFDRYLKGTSNGWEVDTPEVLLEVREPGVGTGVAKRRVAQSWPVADTTYTKLHCDAGSGTMSSVAPSAAGATSYDALTGKATFTYTFPSDIEVTGFLKAKLWVEVRGGKDLDLFITTAKLPLAGAPVPLTDTRQRASLRELATSVSTDYKPVHSFEKNSYLGATEIVPVEVSLRTTAMIFRAGEKIVLTVGGNAMLGGPGALGGAPALSAVTNSGTHVIHSGGTYDSYLQIPSLPM